MKFTLSWLKDHLETEASLEEILDTLTVIGLEVEDVINPAETLASFIVVDVKSAERHPDADKLQVCKVFTGSETLQVVCGAPNARAGMKAVFAPVGTYVPGIDFTLAKAKIRGVESFGMMCSESELQLSEAHEGIIDLPADAEVGKTFVEVAGLDDPVIEVKVTPNRPDCLGVRGIARDLAAAGLGKLKADKVKSRPGKGKCPVPIKLEFSKETADACPVFGGRVIRGLKNGPSPEWLQRRLTAIGLRPINALVDITNYVSYDRCRPLHVYDVAKLSGAVRARLGKAGEEFIALDGKTYKVDDEMCVIADDEGVLGLGGVMGGEASGSTEETTDVLVESAYFDPIRTAMTGRKANIISDARFRFERGIDPQSIELGLDMASELILEICGGEPSEITIAGKPPKAAKPITFNMDEVRRLTGVKFKDTEIKQTLKKLGFEIEGKGEKVKVAIPSWRPDVSQSADLVEEVIRIAGVDKVPSVPLPMPGGVAKPVLTQRQKRVRAVRRSLAARGCVEAVTWSFIPHAQAELFGGGGAELELANPISMDMSSMRPSLLPGLIVSAQRNRDRSFPDCALFEVGNIYRGDKPEDQITAISAVRFGTAKLDGYGRHWTGTMKAVDVFDAKADAIAMLEALGMDGGSVQITRDAPDWYHPGRSGVVRLGPKNVLAHFGELHPTALAKVGSAGPAVAFELFLEAVPQPKKKGLAKSSMQTADLQPVRRDFAFVLSSDVPAQDVVRAARGADKALITDVLVFDLFEGDAIGAGKKSLAIEVMLQPREKTLTDQEIKEVSDKVEQAVKKATGGEIRT